MTTEFIVAMCVVAPAVTLTAAGLLHTLHRAQLAAELARQGAWTALTIRLAARLLGPFEQLAGLGLVVSAVLTILSREHHLVVLMLAGSGAAFAAFGTVSVVLLWKHPGVPCACSGFETPVSWLVPARAFVLFVACGLAASRADVLAELDALSAATASGLFAGLAFGALLWVLPDVMAAPSARRVGVGPRL